jgi:hypothetical protein
MKTEPAAVWRDLLPPLHTTVYPSGSQLSGSGPIVAILTLIDPVVGSGSVGPLSRLRSAEQAQKRQHTRTRLDARVTE